MSKPLKVRFKTGSSHVLRPFKSAPYQAVLRVPRRIVEEEGVKKGDEVLVSLPNLMESAGLGGSPA